MSLRGHDSVYGMAGVLWLCPGLCKQTWHLLPASAVLAKNHPHPAKSLWTLQGHPAWSFALSVM